MLPPKIGDGVLGSNCGGVKPTGASAFFTGASSVLPSAAETFIDVVLVVVMNLRGLGVVKVEVRDCFHGTVTRSERAVGVKRVAWVAMAMKTIKGLERLVMNWVVCYGGR